MSEHDEADAWLHEQTAPPDTDLYNIVMVYIFMAYTVMALAWLREQAGLQTRTCTIPRNKTCR